MLSRFLFAALVPALLSACAPLRVDETEGFARLLAAPQYLEDHQKLLARLEAEPGLYEKVLVTKFNAGLHDIAPPGSADFVLTFRNLHNWIERGEVEGALRAFHKALKLAGASEVNANARDTKDHPEGVWTLPPTYRLKDKDRAKYAAIGESDRFTLKFVRQ